MSARQFTYCIKKKKYQSSLTIVDSGIEVKKKVLDALLF